MTWAPRSRTDEEGNAYGSEREEEDEEEDEEDSKRELELEEEELGGEEEDIGGEGLADDDEDEEIDLENLDGAVAEPELALTGASHRDGDLGLEPISDSKNSDSDDSSEGLEERPLPVLSLAPVPPPVATAPPSPPSPPAGLDPCAPAPAPASALQKPKIWSLAETATSPDNPRRSPQGPSSGQGQVLAHYNSWPWRSRACASPLVAGMGTEEAGYRTCGFRGRCSLTGRWGESPHSCVLSMGVLLGLVVTD